MLNVICQAVRPTTNSKITVMVPQHVGTLRPQRLDRLLGVTTAQVFDHTDILGEA